MPCTVTRPQRSRIGKRMVWGPILRVGVVLRLLKQRVCNGKSIQVQRFAHVGRWFLVLATKVGVSLLLPNIF